MILVVFPLLLIRPCERKPENQRRTSWISICKRLEAEHILEGESGGGDIWQSKGQKLQSFSNFLSVVYADNYEDLAVKAACSKSAQGQAKDKLQQDEQSKRFQVGHR